MGSFHCRAETPLTPLIKSILAFSQLMATNRVSPSYDNFCKILQKLFIIKKDGKLGQKIVPKNQSTFLMILKMQILYHNVFLDGYFNKR